jgi:C4-dicarboxylate-binding protein DctP
MLSRILAGLLLPFLFAAPGFGEEPTIHIRLSTQIPAGSEQHQNMVFFKERVEADSGGSIAVDIFDSGKLFDSDAIAGALSAGKVEMGHVNLSRYADTIALADAFSLPFLFSDETVERASRKPGSEVRKLVDQAILDQSGTRVLWWIPEGSFVLLTKQVPITTPDALQGKTVRSSGPTTAATLEACGGKPVEVPATQQAEAYSSGRVDVGMTSVVSLMGRKLYQSMKTITRTNQAILDGAVAINEAYLQSLSGKQRKIILDAAAATDQRSAERFVTFEEKAYRQLVEQEGVKVLTLSTADLMLWRICSSDVLTGFITRAGVSGQRLMAAYARLLQDPCCNTSRGYRPGS